MQRAIALVGLGLWLWCAGHARADTMPLLPPLDAPQALQLDAPCIAQADLIARVQALLPEDVQATDVLGGGKVQTQAVGAEHSVDIRLAGRGEQPDLTRTLRGESCESVIDAAIIVIGLWVSGQPAPLPSPPQPALPEPGPPPPLLSPTPERPDPSIAFGLAFGASLAGELLPGLAVGLEAAGVVRWQGLGLMLGVRGWPVQSTRLRAAPDVGAEASLIEGVLRVGVLPLELGIVSLGPSLALALGQLDARGLNAADSFEKSLLWLRSDLELSGRIALIRPLAVLFAAGVGVAWSRPVLSITGVGPAFQPQRFAPYAGLGVEALLE